MKVIGAGFGRTGTLSLKAALEQLGFGPCYHMTEVMEHPEHARFWAAAHNGEVDNWNQMFDAYQSTTDWPACTFWRELSEVYPDAKVLLNYRDPDRWYDSMAKTILAQREGGFPDPSSMTGPAADFVRMFQAMKTVHEGMRDREQALETFRQHYAAVQEGIPADRLLVYEVKQGWEPLCAFLEVPVPDEPFPRLNDSESFTETASKMFARFDEMAGSADQLAGGGHDLPRPTS